MLWIARMEKHSRLPAGIYDIQIDDIHHFKELQNAGLIRYERKVNILSVI